LNRDNSPDWRRKIADSPLASQLLGNEALEHSIDRALVKWDGRDIWLFAYGSLIWNPQVKFEEARIGVVHGYHRSFCLWSRINRGTPEKPGLVLALDRGGSCGGLAYRIAARHVREELAHLWQREMLLGSYHPMWVNFRSKEQQAWPALAFVINRDCSGYAGRLSDAVMLTALKSACGRYGTCADYLARTVEGLRLHGIKDHRLMRLHKLMIQSEEPS
jgi:cation transport protein ChaC